MNMDGTPACSLQGHIERLQIDASSIGPARYRFAFQGDRLLGVDLNDCIGLGLLIEPLGLICCRACQEQSRRSYGGGYCYDCFSRLARCDLCVVSPDRCHYHLGTCREPDWGESFCMQPHLVYIANTSGVKVGITRLGSQRGRWLDQGAIEALVIMEARTRRDAGLAEVAIGSSMPDRTDWQRMLQPHVPSLDLHQHLTQLRLQALDLPADVRWLERSEVNRFSYPLARCPTPLTSLKLNEGTVRGNLLGMKGQYLVLSSGAMNVRQHAGYEVRVTIADAPFDDAGDSGTQLGLFQDA